MRFGEAEHAAAAAAAAVIREKIRRSLTTPRDVASVNSPLPPPRSYPHNVRYRVISRPSVEGNVKGAKGGDNSKNFRANIGAASFDLHLPRARLVNLPIIPSHRRRAEGSVASFKIKMKNRAPCSARG